MPLLFFIIIKEIYKFQMKVKLNTYYLSITVLKNSLVKNILYIKISQRIMDFHEKIYICIPRKKILP